MPGGEHHRAVHGALCLADSRFTVTSDDQGLFGDTVKKHLEGMGFASPAVPPKEWTGAAAALWHRMASITWLEVGVLRRPIPPKDFEGNGSPRARLRACALSSGLSALRRRWLSDPTPRFRPARAS